MENKSNIMAKFIEIKVFDENHPDKIKTRNINIDQIGYFEDASNPQYSKRIFINAAHYFVFAPYSVDEFLSLMQ
ncbi:MAG: hypothetical protein WAT91_14100 [Saprospiraceae bacterium]